MNLEKPLNFLHIIKVNLAVACGFVVLGYFGALLNTPPSNASPVWPPAGLALAAVLVSGKRSIPGVFLGALILNTYTHLDFSTPESIVPTLLSAAFISLGSSAQAFFGASSIHYFLGKHDPLIEDSKIIRFFLLAAPASCIVSPTVGNATIFFQGFITLDDIPISWITWWVGDCIGVIIFTPIILAFIAKPKNLWKLRQKTVSYPLLGMFLLVVSIFLYNQQQEADRTALVFERQVNKFHSIFNNAILHHVEINQILKSFFDSSQFVTEQQFHDFTQSILKKTDSIQALEWISYVPSSLRKQYESPEHAGIIIRQPNLNNQMVPASERSEYFPVTYVQPLQQNRRAQGFDNSTNPIALRALLEAKASGKTIITEPLQLVQDLEKKTGFVLYSPVYEKKSPSESSISNSNNALKGYTACVFRMEDEIKTVFSDFPDVQLYIKIEDQGHTLFSNFPDSELAQLNLLSLQKTRQIAVANRIWSVTYQPAADFYHTQVSWTIWWLFLGGLTITSLTGIGLLMLIGRTLRTEELVRTRTLDLVKSEERWQFALEGSRDVVWDWNVATDEIFFSSRLKNMLGYQQNELMSKFKDWGKLIHPDDREHVYLELYRYFDQQTPYYETEHRMLCKDGSYKWLLDRGKVVTWSENNKPERMIGTHMDITERKLAEEQQQLSSRVFNETKEGIIITDANGLIVDVNPAFCDITGYTRAEVIDQNPSILSSGKHGTQFYAEMWKALLEEGHWQGEVWNRNKEGELYAELLNISSILDKKGNILHYVGLFSDITKAKKQQEALVLMAHYDVLTKLPNRVLLADRFLQATAHSIRHENLLAVCFLDLDNFKPVNDSFGHETGDQLLIEVAKRIKNHIRNEDTVSRQGGDEFVLLLGDIESIVQCELMLERILESLAQPYTINDLSLSISASIGFSVYPKDNADLDTLMRHADQAMYQAKITGRNCFFQFNAEQDQQTIQKNVQLKEIKQALSNQQFCLYYQPKVNMATGNVFGAEALIRWLHPVHGLIPPIKFLPVIEGTELEFVFGNWVINEALKQLKDWNEQGLDLEVSVNVSSYYLQHPTFLADLEHTLSLYPEVDSNSLQLEILESSALGDLQSVSSIINQCINDLGVNIALDDFGTGYSSLTHMKNLPAETIKIDQSFVRDMLDDPNDYAIIDGVIGLANSFNRNVIAEGVETSEIGLMLLIMGCQEAQGYGIARPMPAEEIKNWLTNYTPNQVWLSFADKSPTHKERKTGVLSLSVNHWVNKLETNINSTTDNIEHWPVMNNAKCHCGIWIKRESQESLFDSEWMDKLNKEHNVLHHLAMHLKLKYQSGEIDLARNGLGNIRKISDKISTILEHQA